MTNLKRKMKKQEGFTLIEMLIVVAIIAILIAISIPLVGSALERARQATDAANERAAKAEITIMYLNATAGADDSNEYKKDKIYAYDASTGKMIDTVPTVKYGQCTTDSHKGQYLIVKYDEENQTVVMAWSSAANIPGTITAGTLCSAKVGNVNP